MIQISSGKLLGSFIEHEDIVTSISLSYERHLFLSKLKTIEQSQIEENLANPLIISTSFDGQVYLWDLVSSILEILFFYIINCYFFLY